MKIPELKTFTPLLRMPEAEMTFEHYEQLWEILALQKLCDGGLNGRRKRGNKECPGLA